MSSTKRLDHNIKINNLSGMAQSFAANMFQPFIGIFAIKLGASNGQVALLSSLPALVSVIAGLPGALLIRKSDSKKHITSLLTILNRVFYFFVALVPMLPEAYRPLGLVLLIGLMNLPGAASLVAWQTLMGNLIPKERRGDAFSSRNRLMTLVGFGPTLAVGYILDRLRFPMGYQLIFSIAFVVALAEVIFLMKLDEGEALQREPSSEDDAVKYTNSPSIRSVIRSAWQDREYRIFNIHSLLWYFSWQMGWPLFTIYQVRYLGANNTWTGFFAVSSSLMSFVSYKWWGRYGDKVGNVRGLVWATFGMSITPALYAVSNNLIYIVLLNLSIGYFVSGTTLFLFNGLLEVTPEETRAEYLSINSTIINISAFIAPFVGKYLVDITGIKGALLITAVVRLAACLGFYTLGRQQSCRLGLEKDGA